MADLSEFDFTNVQASDFSPIPDGEYLMTICDSKIDFNPNTNEKTLSMTYRIDEGAYRNRKVFERFRLWNQNPDWRNMAARNLKTLATAAGYANPNFIKDTSDLHGLSFVGKLVTSEGKDGRSFQNVRGYKKVANAPAAAPKAQPMSRGSEQAQMPW